MRRILLLSLILAVSGCGEDPAEQATPPSPAPDTETVECALDGQPAFTAACTVEKAEGPDGLTLTLRSPSGSFRRLLVVKDGRGVIAADGVDKAQVSTIAGNRIEVAIAGDRYRLPATVRQ